jgi:hypothetical protein
MDETGFDRWTAALAGSPTRRSALRLLGHVGLAGVMGHTSVEAKKHRKKKKKNGGAACQSQCQGKQCGDDGCGGVCGGCEDNQVCAVETCCLPEPVGNTCQGRCGTFTNNCGQSVPCSACGTGHQCLSNGSCALPCPAETCNNGCVCSFANTEGETLCSRASNSCATTPQVCSATAECPLGQHCAPTGCGPGGTLENRCGPLCL